MPSHRKPTDQLQYAASIIAMFVRDGLEDMHHEGSLPQELMPALNTHIRDAIYTALYTMEHAPEDWRSDRLLDMKRQAIPAYWEAPKLWAELATSREIDKKASLYFRQLHAEKYGLPVVDE